MATTLADLLKAALRIAGITVLPGTTPSTDQYAELIPLVNDMLASYSLDGHRIYTTDIATYPLTSGTKIYTIGPGGTFNAPRPLFIKEANLLYPTSPVVRRPIDVISDDEWASIRVQDITSAPPYKLYYAGGMDANGRASIYIYFQPPAGYTLELYTWLELKDDFTAVTDSVVLPPGYNELIKWNLAIRVAGLYPLEAKLAPDARDMAAKALSNVVTLNADMPKVNTGFGFTRNYGGNARPWLDGGIR